MYEENKDLIWVDKKLAEEYKSLESDESKEILVRQIIDRKKLDISADLESMEEAVLRFKAAGLIHKNALRQVYLDQDTELYSMWEHMGDIDSKIRKHVREMSDLAKSANQEIESLKTNLNIVSKEISNLESWKIEGLMKLVAQLSAMDESTKDIFSFLAKNYTKAESK